MAGLHKRTDGSYFIEFMLRGERKTVSVGKAPKTARESVKGWIERLVTAASLCTSPDAETCSWLSKINDKLAARLATVGLIEPREPKERQQSSTLGPFLDSYLALRTDVKPRTKLMFKQVRGWLVDYFGTDKPLDGITRGDADEWRLWLNKQGRYKGRMLGRNTI